MAENKYSLTKKGQFPIKEKDKYAGTADSYKICIGTTDREFLDFMDEKLDECIAEYKLNLRKK